MKRKVIAVVMLLGVTATVQTKLDLKKKWKKTKKDVKKVVKKETKKAQTAWKTRKPIAKKGWKVTKKGAGKAWEIHKKSHDVKRKTVSGAKMPFGWATAKVIEGVSEGIKETEKIFKR